MLNNHNRRKGTCSHNVYIKGLCGNCGIRLDPPQSTSVSMIHSVPELKVSEDYAKEIGKADQERLIKERKLVLLVDLDQTILHTTHEKVKDHPSVRSFKLWPGHPTYYTKLRPYLEDFLERMSKIYELHIFTFGCRMYAHKIASLIDPKQKYFGNRILSRDESVDQYSKQGNLNNLFPCGDAMVCIIDDRADVWRNAGNLIQVKPYSYFETSISDGVMLKNSSVEDDESLDAEVDKLEALLGVEHNGDDDKEHCDSESVNAEPAATDDSKATTAKQYDDRQGDKGDKDVKNDDNDDEDNDDDDDDDDEKEHNALPTSESDNKTSHDSDQGPTSVTTSSDHKSEESLKANPLDEDPDDYLLSLANILSRIHEKWYMELDEQRLFLVDGENYKLPDIKDIIKRYLRKRYH